MSLRSVIPSLALGLLLAGCGSSTDDPKTPAPVPVEPQPVEPTPEEPLPADAVRVTHTVRHLTANGEVVRAQALTDVELLLPTDTGYSRVPVTEERTGRATVRNIPEGRTFLVRTGTRYLLSSARELDLGGYSAERPDTVRTEAFGTTATVSVSGMQPWEEAGRDPNHGGNGFNDELYLFWPETDTLHSLELDRTPDTGVTSLQAEPARLQSINGRALARLSAGQESLVMTQLSLRKAQTTAGTELAYTAVRKAATLPAPAFTGTESFTLDASLQAVPQQSLSMDFRGTAFAALATDVHPAALPGTSFVDVSPVAFAPEHGWPGFAGWLLTYPQSTPADVEATLEYGSPYPSSWGRVTGVTASFRVAMQLPTGERTTQTASIGLEGHTDALAGTPLAPSISPPRSLKLDGASANGERATLASRAPVLSWEPPAQGTPSFYEVTVRRVYVLDGGLRRATAARLRLPGSTGSLRLPDGILQAGQHYVFIVGAYHAPHWQERPLDFSLPTAYAEAITSLYTAP